MIRRYCDGCVPTPGEPSTGESAPRLRCDGLGHEVFGHVAEFAVNRALVSLGEAVGDINRYVEHAAEGLRLTSVLLWPVMVELWHCLGWQPPGRLSEALSWAGLALGTPVVSGPPLFLRLQA